MGLKESTLRNLVLVLCSVSLIAALALGGTNVATREAIEQAQKQKVEGALQEVFEDFDNSSEPAEVKVDEGEDAEPLAVYRLEKGGEWVGSAVESYSEQGFGGRIEVMVGFDTEGKVTGYSVLSHAETPGLGDRMVDWFQPPKAPVRSLIERLFGITVKQSERSSNIYGMNPSEAPLVVSKDGGAIDAITAATISSRAFLDAINRASAAFAVSCGEGSDNGWSGATPADENASGEDGIDEDNTLQEAEVDEVSQ